jgi:hypothetical protein
MLNCDEKEGHKKFEFGYIIIVAIDSIIILGVSLHSRVWSYTWRGNEVGIIGTWKWVLPAVIILGGLVVLIRWLGVFLETAEIFGAVIAAICLIVCMNELLFLMKCARRPVFKIIRICDLISVPVSIMAIISIQLFTKDYITNDVLAICIIVACIKIFKFGSLRDALICCALVMTMETLAAVYYHWTSPNHSYNDIFGRDIVSPLII